MSVELIIFDCDGVLVDSEIIACRIDAEELTRLGVPMTTNEVIRRFAGVSQKDMRVTIVREHCIKLPNDYDQRIKHLTEQAFPLELRPIPRIHQALDAIEVPVCVASSSTPEKIKLSLL